MKVSEENWQQLLELLDLYLELPADGREALLTRTDTESPARGASLRQLIRDFEAGALLSAQDFMSLSRPRRPRILSAGRIIGRYRLTRVLGRGALSAVWLAEQRGFSAARPVALKFFFSSTHEVLERERLGTLHQPGIARLLDTGLTDDGQSYLAWEYIDGLPLLKYAAAQQLSIARRVALFAEVLTSLSYAHAHLVLHGSLKPANVLVDAEGHTHLLDTGTSSYPPGRSDYSSPEQILGEVRSVASDLYSAAVLLFELLSGQRPYRLAQPMGKARADAILSARAPALAAVAADSQAAFCGCTPRALKRLLGGDLEAILQRALEKDPARRYTSADGFAQDLRRWLRRERVSARADSTGYRVAQFLRRNPWVAGGLAAVLLALTVSLALAVARTRAARLQAAQAGALSHFLAGLFDHPAPGPTAADLLNAGMERVHAELGELPDAEIEALGILAGLYAQLDDPDGASRAEAARLALLERRFGAQDVRVIDALLDDAGHLREGAQRAQAPALLARAAAALDARHAADAPRRARLLLEQSRLARYSAVSDSRRLADQAVELLSRDDPHDRLVEALRDTSQARVLLGDLPGARDALVRAAGILELRHPQEARWRDDTLCDLARVQAQLLEVDDAEAKFRDCLALSRQLRGATGILTARRELSFARFLQDTGRAEEARTLLDERARASTEFWQQDGLLQAALAAGRLDEAQQRLERYVPQLQQRLPASLLAARATLAQATLLTAAGRFADAAALETTALADARRSLGTLAEPSAMNALLLAAARLDLERGDPAAALERLQDVHDPASGPVPRPERLEAQLLHARALFAMHRLDEATVEAGAVLESVRRSPLHAALARLEADTSLTLAQLQIAAERYLEAQLHAERALSLRQASQDPKSLAIAEAQLTLAQSLIAQRQLPLAQQQLAAAAGLLAAQPAAGPQYTGPVKSATEELARALHPAKPKRR